MHGGVFRVLFLPYEPFNPVLVFGPIYLIGTWRRKNEPIVIGSYWKVPCRKNPSRTVGLTL